MSYKNKLLKKETLLPENQIRNLSGDFRLYLIENFLGIFVEESVDGLTFI